MATLETQKLDSIIASRRTLLKGVGALAATAVAGEGVARASIPSAPADTDILNFALNLEYLEAQFYTLAVEGTTADKSTYGSAIGTGMGSATTGGGTVTYKTTMSPQVNFVNQSVKAYAIETALEERKHVNFLRGALGSAAVAQPNIDLVNSFNTLAMAAFGIPAFDPFASGYNFLLGAFVFEDVGVTAYHGGAAYLAASKTYLTPAVGIHAVEAMHAGLVRSTLYAAEQGTIVIGGSPAPKLGLISGATDAIANTRAKLDGTYGMAPTDAVGLTGQDDFGLYSIPVPLNTSTANAYTASTIMDAGKVVSGSSTPTYNYYVGFARTLLQVLAIVYGSPVTSSSSTVKAGLFFPNGLNGNIS